MINANVFGRPRLQKAFWVDDRKILDLLKTKLADCGMILVKLEVRVSTNKILDLGMLLFSEILNTEFIKFIVDRQRLKLAIFRINQINFLRYFFQIQELSCGHIFELFKFKSIF